MLYKFITSDEICPFLWVTPLCGLQNFNNYDSRIRTSNFYACVDIFDNFNLLVKINETCKLGI